MEEALSTKEHAFPGDAAGAARGLRLWIWIVGAALLTLVLNVAIHVLYMVVYGYVLAPGRPEHHYEEHAQATAPYFSMVVGFALMFLAARTVGRRAPAGRAVFAAVSVAGVYTAVDGGILLAVGFDARIAVLASLSALCKLLGAYLGGRAAEKAATDRRMRENREPGIVQGTDPVR
jgi:hypothetical protein